MKDSGLEYWIKDTDSALPNIVGKYERTKSQLPQQPNGTKEKNEKNALSAVLLELIPNIPFCFLSILNPMPLL